jgi:hypothetical protein
MDFVADFAYVFKYLKFADNEDKIRKGKAFILELNEVYRGKIDEEHADEVLGLIMSGLLGYVQDTEEHLEKLYHKPEWNNWQTVRVFPDIVNYIPQEIYAAVMSSKYYELSDIKEI